MTKQYLAISTSLALVILIAAVFDGASLAQDTAIPKAEFNADGSVKIPKNWRSWIYIGTPLTPNALNNGEAPFPEFHNVYIEPKAYAQFAKTGKFPNGTQIAKELVLIRQKPKDEMYPDGSTDEVSGRGYFQGEFHGLELSYKDTEKYPKEPGGWVYFSFGHKALPYDATAKVFATDKCNACHEASAATDFVFTQFYPVLRAQMKK